MFGLWPPVPRRRFVAPEQTRTPTDRSRADLSWPHPNPNLEALAKGRRAAELEHKERADNEWIAACLDAIAADLRTAYDEAMKEGGRVAYHAGEFDYGRIAVENLAREVRGARPRPRAARGEGSGRD